MKKSQRPLSGLLSADAISQFGNTFSLIVIPWFVLETTGSASQTGITVVTGVVPYVVVGILAGSVSRPVVNIVGTQVALGPLSQVQLSRYQIWMNDVATQGWAGFPPRPEPFTGERMAEWYRRAATDSERMHFTIYETTTWRAVGFCMLRDIDPLHGTAGFALTIGDPADRGKGYGTEATRLLLDLAFTGLGLHNVQPQVHASNTAAQRAYQKVGFKEIGRRRSAVFMGGGRWDVIFMDILAEEFESPVLSQLLHPNPSPKSDG